MTADQIKQWRTSHGLSQSALAALLPVSIKTLQNWEQGRDKAPEYLRRALNDVDRELNRKR